MKNLKQSDGDFKTLIQISVGIEIINKMERLASLQLLQETLRTVQAGQTNVSLIPTV